MNTLPGKVGPHWGLFESYVLFCYLSLSVLEQGWAHFLTVLLFTETTLLTAIL